MDEMIEVMRKLWSGGMVEHHGEFYRFDPLEMSPTPGAPVPIFVGGLSEPALRRAARLGDGWVSDLHSTEELRAVVGRLHDLRAAAGRPSESFTVVAAASDAADLDGYRRVEEAGVTQLMTMPWLFYGGPTDDLERRCDGIHRFGEEVIDRLG
jgi:alkanesulfonate monooxygenase SsuD/methylene tetrahydromethanopterin reductase-like flavin-dependent oxidoreductase (luciferase family)